MATVEFLEPAGSEVVKGKRWWDRITPEIVEDVAELCGWELLPAKVEMWTKYELLMAYDYFMRVHLRASDNLIRERPLPYCVAASQAH